VPKATDTGHPLSSRIPGKHIGVIYVNYFLL